MLTEQEILEIGFEKLDCSDTDNQYYVLRLERPDIQDNAYNEYALTVSTVEVHMHTFVDKLRIGGSQWVLIKQKLTYFESKEDLENLLLDWMKWDVAH